MATEEGMEKFIRSLEAQGEKETRRKLALGKYGAKRLLHARQWLEEQERSRIELEKKEKALRELESLRLHKERNYVSWCALLVSLISLAISIFAVINR